MRAEAHTRCIVFGDDTPRTDVFASSGSIFSGGLTDIGASDDSRLIVRDVPSGPFDPVLKTETVVVFEDSIVGLEPVEIDLRIESNVSLDDVAGTIALKNWVTGTWFDVGVYNPVKDEDTDFWTRGIQAAATGTTPDFDFVRDTDGRIECRITHQVNSSGPSTTLDSRFDFVQAVVLRD